MTQSTRMLYANEKEFQKFRKAIQKLIKQSDDLSQPLSDIADRFRESRKFIFDKSRKSPGQYKDLSPNYKKQKNKDLGFAYPILLRTGRLRDSITTKNSESITEIGKKYLVLGTKVPYSGYHQSGTSVMPQRPFLFWGPEAPRHSNHKSIKNLHRNVAKILYVFIERRAGKTLNAAVKAADRRIERLFS